MNEAYNPHYQNEAHNPSIRNDATPKYIDVPTINWCGVEYYNADWAREFLKAIGANDAAHVTTQLDAHQFHPCGAHLHGANVAPSVEVVTPNVQAELL